MAIIAIGCDSSKGYADFCFQNEAGSALWPSDRYDDTPGGHTAVLEALARLREQHPGVQFLIGVECTGGLERNWLRTFRAVGADCRVYRLNPLAVKKFLERDLHRNVTDEISAQGIATYLRLGLRPADRPYEPELEGARNLLRHILNGTERCTQLKNELQSLLPSVHPDLVQYCRQSVPQWVLLLLKQYPTVVQLGQADRAEVAKIAYMKKGRAGKLIAGAQASIAALRDETTGLVVQDLAEQILQQTKRVEGHKSGLCKQLKDDQEVKLLDSIHGIGLWTAVILRLEVGPFDRFHHDRAVVAFAGLDPRVRKSGDGEQHIGISHRGKHQLRACLYMPALAATRCNPVIKEFYQRLRGKGKLHLVALVACMSKLLRIAYACVVSGRPFDPEYAAKRKQQQEEAGQAKAEAVPTRPAVCGTKAGSLEAPVSRREAKKRRVASKAQPILCG